MKEIKIINTTLIALVDDCDFENINQFKWGLHPDGYANRSSFLLGPVLMHHFVLGKPPEGYVVDHINGHRLDNQKHNLRLITHSQSAMNRCVRSDNQSGLKGVGLHRSTGKWRARIKVKGVDIWLGLHETKEQASEVYRKSAKQYFGEFSNES